jgi:hypothetical protein
MLNSWATLVRLRPSVLQTLLSALRPWTPAALENLSPSNIKSVEKAVRILLVHINRFERFLYIELFMILISQLFQALRSGQ